MEYPLADSTAVYPKGENVEGGVPLYYWYKGLPQNAEILSGAAWSWSISPTTTSTTLAAGRAFVQFLALVLTACLRAALNTAWDNRPDVPKDDRLARRYSLAGMMMRLGTYRKTTFSDRYGAAISVPTKAQRTIFKALGVRVAP